MAKRKRGGRQGREQSPSKTANRHGSHAGRGFRYQDAAAAWLAVRCWAGDFDYGGVTPEGGDDVEISGSQGTTFGQVKSRRDQLGPYHPGDVAGYTREIWKRAQSARPNPEHVILVLERGVHGQDLPQGDEVPIAEVSRLASLLSKDKLSRRWLSRTGIVVVPDPSERAIQLLEERLGSRPVMAGIYFAAIADRIGHLSDENGLRSPGGFASLSTSDVAREIEALAGVLSTADLDGPIRRGLCQPVDFLTPLDDRNVYLGVDVQPGHWAAGLLTERPEARARILEALEEGRAVLIAGPSGSGKSALMWEAARHSRHTVRWFRIRHAGEEHAADLVRLTDTYRATSHSPIGFVMDDVGRSQSGLWDVLAAEAAARHDLVVLGSIREEDSFLIARRSLVTEIRQLPESSLAERVWSELRERGLTDWPGWREPWQAAEGLLLEYTHLLTQQLRLKNVLKEQVDRRVREERTAELTVLRIASIAGRVGASIPHVELRRVLDLSSDDLSSALRRLVDEHLVQRLSGGERLGGLHQIRSAALADLCHDFPPPTIRDSVKATLDCVVADDLETFVARTLRLDSSLRDPMVEAAASRALREGGVGSLAAVLRGLDFASIDDAVARWLPEAERLKLPPTQLTTAAMFAVAKTPPFLQEKLASHFEAARLLREMPVRNHREDLLSLIGEEVSTILPHEAKWHEVTSLLGSLVGVGSAPMLEERLGELQPNLLAMPLVEAIALLENACASFPTAARVWVERAGQGELLVRLSREQPWISVPQLCHEEEGLAVAANLFHVSDRWQRDLHGQVVELCRRLLALAPAADLAVVSALSPGGEPAGLSHFPIAVKRIPRSNLPALATSNRNRLWLAAVARRCAPRGFSRYLLEAARLLDDLLPPLINILGGFLHEQVRGKNLRALGEVLERSQGLLRPPDLQDVEKAALAGVSDLQSVIHFSSTDLVRRFSELPDNAAAAFSQASEAIAQIDRAKVAEPWVLLGGEPPAALDRLRDIIAQIRLIIGEAGARQVKAYRLAPSIVRSSSSSKNLHRLANWSERQVAARLLRLNSDVMRALDAHGYGGRADSRIVSEIGSPWPYAEVLVVVTLERVEDWLVAQQTLDSPLREVCGDGRKLTLVPAVRGSSLPDLAVGGVQTLLPLQEVEEAWLEGLGFSPADLPMTKLFDDWATALHECAAIEAFGCGGEERAPDEGTKLKRAREEVREKRRALGDALPTATSVELAAGLDGLEAMGPNLAVERGIHDNAISEAGALLTATKLIIIAADLERVAAGPSHGD